eukprot:4011093-Pleurochrysis_carterae.AAC.2
MASGGGWRASSQGGGGVPSAGGSVEGGEGARGSESCTKGSAVCAREVQPALALDTPQAARGSRASNAGWKATVETVPGLAKPAVTGYERGVGVRAKGLHVEYEPDRGVPLVQKDTRRQRSAIRWVFQYVFCSRGIGCALKPGGAPNNLVGLGQFACVLQRSVRQAHDMVPVTERPVEARRPLHPVWSRSVTRRK